MIRFALALVALLASTAPAFADDILFIGLNAAYHEMVAARKAAEKTGRHLVIFPELEEAEWKRYYDLAGAEASIRRKIDTECRGKGVDHCTAFATKYNKELERIATLNSAFFAKATFSESNFKDFLAKRKAENKTFGSVIVSGHDGTGTLSGSLGNIRHEKLAELLSNAGQRDAIRSLHLWGCYTASASSIMLDWKKSFPNIHFVAGYDGRAPLADKPAGWQYLQGVIEREDKLHRITDAKKLQAALKAIPGAIQLNAAVANCDSYANMKEAFEFSDFKAQCERYEKQLQAAMPKYECYLRGEVGCENVPEDTGQGVLRDFYGLTQKSEPCRQAAPSATFDAHSRDEAMRLLFYRFVVGNFGRLYEMQLQEIDESLAQLSAPTELRFAKIAEMSRADLNHKLEQLEAFLRGRLRNFEQDPRKFVVDAETANLHMLRNFLVAGTQALSKLSNSCVPYSWHEPNSPDALTCGSGSELGRSGVVRALSASDATKRWGLEVTAQNLQRDLEQGKLGQSEGDRLVYRARLELFNATSQERPKKPAEAALAWAELVQKLEKEGVEKPAEDPRALSLQYDRSIAAFEADLDLQTQILKSRSLSADPENQVAKETRDNAQADADIAELSLQTVRLRKQLLRPDLPSEEKEATRARIEANEAKLGPILSAQAIKRQKALLEFNESMAHEVERMLNRSNINATMRSDYTKVMERVNESRSEIDEANRDPAAYAARKIGESLYAAPVDLKPFKGDTSGLNNEL